jgi:hypothetical protein
MNRLLNVFKNWGNEFYRRVLQNCMNQLLNVFRNRRNEFYQWALHNLVFGLAGVWIPFVFLLCFGKLTIIEAFTNGSILMFSVTSCAISIGFFAKQTQVRLTRAYTLTYAGLMVTMLISVLVLTAIITVGTFKSMQPPITLDMPVIYTLSVFVVLSAIVLNFRLFMAEQGGPQPSAIERQLSQDADRLTDQSRQETHALGVQL